MPRCTFQGTAPACTQRCVSTRPSPLACRTAPACESMAALTMSTGSCGGTLRVAAGWPTSSSSGTRSPSVSVGTGFAQAPDHLLQHFVGDAGVFHQEWLDIPRHHGQADCIGVRLDIGRPRAAVQDGNFAEEIARSHLRHGMAIAFDRYRAFLDDEQALAGRAVLDDDRTLFVALLLQAPAHHLQLVLVEPGKERDLPEFRGRVGFGHVTPPKRSATRVRYHLSNPGPG